MNIRPHDYSVPNLPQFRPLGNPLETDPGFFAELGAAFERNTAVAAIHWLSQQEFAPDPNFDFDARAKKSELYARHPRQFLDVRSEAEFAQMEARVARAEESDRVLSAGGASAWVAALAAGVVDPVNLLPAGSIYRGYRVGNVLRTLMSTGAAGAVAGGVNEAALQADIPQRTAGEGAVNVAMSGLLSAVLGGTLGVVLRGADRKALERAALDMASDAPSPTRYQPGSPMGSMGAAVNPEAAFENLPQVGELAPAFGFESTVTKINPIGRVLTNKSSPTARSLQASLDTGGMAFDGVANIGGDVESLAKQHYTLLARTVRKRDEIMGGNRLARLMSIPKFNEEVTLALRRGGQSDDPGVAEFAQFVRAEFFEPLRRMAKEVGMEEFQDLEEEFVEKYAPRFARHSLIARDYDDFQQILEEHFNEKLTSVWAARVEKAEGRASRLNETADILDLDIPQAADRYAQIEGEIAALPEQFEPQVREIAERVRDLREMAKGATKEEAKRLRAEAKALEESNKEMLAPFQTAEKRLKNQFRLLGKSKIGIAGANRRIVERVEATLAAADKSRDLLLKKLNKLAREFEELSEEARDKAIEDAVEQLQRAKELELKALERTRGEVGEEVADEFDTPPGKRTVKINVRGNIVGYVGKKRWMDFGDRSDPAAEARAFQWEKNTPKAEPVDVDAAMAKFEAADEELRALTDLDPAIAADRIESIQSELIAQAELLAAKRKAEVDRLVGKLRNPNEAKAEAAALRQKGTGVWYDLLKRAADENVGLERGKPADISALAKHYADTVASSYLGESARLPFFNIIGGERGPEIARMLDIDETRTWANGKKFEDFLENDIDIVMRRYLRTLAPDIELKRKFGTVNPLSKDSPFMKRIEGEFRDARDEASKITDQKKREKALQRIASERETVIRDLTTGVRRIRNLDGVPENPHGFANRAGRALLNLNTTRLMGKMVIASVSDLAMLMARHGPVRFMRDGIMPLVSNWKQMRLSLEEAQLAGTALDMVLHGRSAAFADVFDDLRMGSAPERGLQFLANNIGFISGMDLWNQNMKRVASSISIARTTRALEKVAEGRASKSDLFHLERLGIDEVLARDIWEAMQDGSTVVNGVRMPNTEDWGKAAFAAGDMEKYNRAMQAKRAFRAALARDIDDTIITPGGEIPAWMTASMTGRLIGQFRRFAFSSTMKVLVAGLQAARVQGRATGSIMALSTVPFFLASGMLSYYLWAAATGGKAWEEMQNADEEKWITEGILRGLPLGVFAEVPKFSEEFLGVSPDREASNFSSNPADLLGPSIGALKDAGRFLSGAFDSEPGLSAGEVGAFKRMLPYNNLWVWDWILRPTFEEVAR